MNKDKKNPQTRKAELIELSAQMRKKVESGQYETINQALIAHYAASGHTELHTFNEWLMLGYKVKKGEKALLLWSKKRTREKAQTEAQKQDEETKSVSFHSVAYLFSNLQVEKKS